MTETQASPAELYKLALDCQKLGDLETAKTHFLGVLRLDPDHADAPRPQGHRAAAPEGGLHQHPG